jgi:drug/metabolite transporter (DMT)-like permease
MHSSQAEAVRATAVLIIVTLFWGLSFPLMKTWQDAAGDCPGGDLLAALTLIILRMFLALAVLGLFRPRLVVAPSRREYATGALIGAVFALGFILQVWGLGRTSPALSAFLTSLGSVWTPLLALALFRIPVARVTLLGLVVGVAGAALLENTSAQAWTPQGGETLTLLCSFVFAAEILMLDRLGRKVHSSHLTVSFLATAGLIALAAGLARAAAGPGVAAWLGWTASMLRQANILGIVAVLTLVCTVLAFHGMNTYQPRVSAARAALIYLLEPVFASFFSLLLQQDRLTLHLALGGGLILGGNLLVEMAGWLQARRASFVAPPTSAR